MPVKVNINTKIRFNGVEYSRVEDMPAEVKQTYERALAQMQASGVNVKTKAKLVFNGHEYDSAEAMPDNIRRLYDQIITSVDANHNGIPDVAEPDQPALEQGSPLFNTPPANQNPQSGAPRTMILAVALILLVIGIVVMIVLTRMGFTFVH